MKESDIGYIAEFMRRVVIDKEKTEFVKEDVIEFKKNFDKIHYCFD